MMRNGISILALPITATGAITSNRFINAAGTLSAAAGNAQGVAQTDGVIGDKVTATVIGTEIVETGGAIAAGALVESDATGRAVTKAAGVTLGRLAPGESATAAGQFVEVILIQN
jgi:hypothetical protein